MVTEALLDVWFALMGGVVGLLPITAVPAWVLDSGDDLASVWGYADGLSAWIPWSFLAMVLAAIIAATLAGFGIKLTRIVLSLFTGGGGGAA